MKFPDFFSKLLGMGSQTPLELWLPSTSAEIGDYQENFERAASFTKHCGFGFPKLKWQSGDVIDSDGALLESACRKAGVLDTARSAGQCLKWSHFLAPAFERALGRTAWLTVGQLWKNNSPVFHPTWDNLRQWGRNGIQVEDFSGRSGLNLHAWVTLATGEIIEPTLLSSLAVADAENFATLAGAMAWGHDPNFLQPYRYFPMVIGSQFADSLSSKSCLPLLANDADELHQMTVGIFNRHHSV